MAVLSPNGAKIGYLRRTLAQVMTARLAVGAQLTAQIAHVCSEEFHPDSRVNIKIQIAQEITELVKTVSKTVIIIQVTEMIHSRSMYECWHSKH